MYQDNPGRILPSMDANQAQEDPMVTAIRATVNARRGAARLTDAELSRRSGVPIRTLTRYLGERNPRPIPTESLVKIVRDGLDESMVSFWIDVEETQARG